ncbi:MAG: hypothetical protein IBX62_10135 [Coriobacteriia bacterium]|nr:hypothetical protein [Coriobacteriia bacterium]
MRQHFAGAKDAGAGIDEIRETIALAIEVGSGRLRNFVTDTLEEITLEMREPARK